MNSIGNSEGDKALIPEEKTKGNGSSSNALVSRGRFLPFRKEHRTNPREIRDGAHAMRRAYFSNGISRRTREGIVIAHLERELAEHRGYPSLAAMPVTQRLKVQLLIGNLIFLSLYEPREDSKTGLRDLHCAQNLVNRLTSELGMEKAKKAIDLAGAFAGMNS
jgi:hypothetical protein